MKTTGLHHSSLTPVGSTVTRSYYASPGLYSLSFDGQEYTCPTDALYAVLEDRDARQDAYDGQITVDHRWMISSPTGTKSLRDVVIERYTFDNRADAEAYIDRVDKYAGVTL